jgi:hypothetical protein
VRWTTAAPAPAGTTFLFTADGPYFREASGAQFFRKECFEARVLSRPDASGNRRVDFFPQSGPGEEQIAGYINGTLCGPPCHDPRFIPH